MSLKQQFLTHFAGQIFTIKQAQQWYQMHKRRPGSYTYLADVYGILIRPLLWEGKLIKAGRGLYRVLDEHLAPPTQSTDQLDEFDAYIAKKLERRNVK